MFEEQQSYIKRTEIKLYNDTQKLLTNMLRSLDVYSLENNIWIPISENERIEKFIVEKTYINIEVFSNEYNEYNIKSIEELSQEQQKDVIDYLLSKNLHFYY
jgi:beta-lactamase class D